jgi:hypothetical protein
VGQKRRRGNLVVALWGGGVLETSTSGGQPETATIAIHVRYAWHRYMKDPIHMK